MTTRTDKSGKTELTLPLNPEKEDWLKSKIRDIPDFPKPGIVFKDITTLLKDREGFGFAVEALAQQSEQLKPDYIAGIEARGFILGATVAHVLGVGFLPIRKPGKLPYETVQIEYELEYGTDTIEMHVDAVSQGERVVLIDDLLATGGTAAGAIQLLDKIGAELVGTGFVVELGFLKGREKLNSGGGEIFSLLFYD